MGFDVANLIVFLLGIAYAAGTIKTKLDTLITGQGTLRLYVEKKFTEIDERMSSIEMVISEHEQKLGEKNA